MTQDDPWLRFEAGTLADLELFLNGALGDHPVRVILAGEHWGPEACRILAAAPAGIDLRFVSLRGALIGDAGIEVLANARVLESLRSLGIERCGLTDRGVQALAKSPYLSKLSGLFLCNRAGIETGPLNQIGDDGAVALAASPCLGRLEKLDLWNTHVGDQGLEAIVVSPQLARLSSLTAWETRLTQEGARRIKALAIERWERGRNLTSPPPYCSIFTDYDERIITYE
jgi:Leucine Rich repeat